MTWEPPTGAATEYDPAPRGRIRRGIWLTRKSWTLMRSGDRMWTLPVLAALTLAVAAVLIFVPLALLVGEHGRGVSLAAGAVAAAFVLTTISTFFSVAFLAQVQALIDGRPTSPSAAFDFARTRLGAIVGWSLLSTAVGTAMRALENVSGGEWLARLIGFLGGLAWSLATFFVIPVLAVEDVGPVDALKRSAEAFKRRWGEQVTGDLVIGGVYTLAIFASMVLFFAGLALAVQVLVVGVVLMIAGVMGALASVVVSSTISRVFSLVVYRHAVGQPLPAPFTEADVAAAFKPKRSWLRRR